MLARLFVCLQLLAVFLLPAINAKLSGQWNGYYNPGNRFDNSFVEPEVVFMNVSGYYLDAIIPKSDLIMGLFVAKYKKDNFQVLRYPLRVERVFRRTKPWYLNMPGVL